MLWKRALAQAVARDLLDGRCGRRIMHVDELGIGGIFMYDIDEGLEWDAVFGSAGMSVDGMLDAIGAQMIYVPLYACTSFAVRIHRLAFGTTDNSKGGLQTGQIMNAFLRGDSSPSVVPESREFLVPSDPLAKLDHCSAFTKDLVTEAVCDENEVTEMLILDEEEPNLVLDDDGDSIYSVGPETPIKTAADFPLYDSGVDLERFEFKYAISKDAMDTDILTEDIFAIAVY